MAIAGPTGTTPSPGTCPVNRPTSTASSVTIAPARIVWKPCRCPPLACSMPRATSSPTTGTECAMVPLWWSASGSSAAPAHTTAPERTPAGDSG